MGNGVLSGVQAEILTEFCLSEIRLAELEVTEALESGNALIQVLIYFYSRLSAYPICKSTWDTLPGVLGSPSQAGSDLTSRFSRL